MGLSVLDSVYTHQVVTVLLVSEQQKEEVAAKITEATSGGVQIEYSEPFYYGLNGKELVLF